MLNERIYIVTYDISNTRRWRRVFKIMNGFGEWIQLSVFQCRLSKRRRAELETQLREAIKADEDHVLLIDIGLVSSAQFAVESIGKSFTPIERQTIVI